ncbi:MAG: hypothetical protein HDS31_02615 [Bacteroides sp.]|nr:hypothetical protein [Bacteroides sp.]
MKRFSYLLLCLACFAMLALGACSKDDPETPDQTEKPDIDPVGPDDPISESDNPFEEGWNDYDDVISWPEEPDKAFVGTWVALNSDLSMLRLELKPSDEFVLMECKNLHSLTDLRFIVGSYKIPQDNNETSCIVSWRDTDDNGRVTISVTKFLPMQFQADITGAGYNCSLTFHRVVSGSLIERDAFLLLPTAMEYSGIPVSLNPRVCSVDNLTVKCEDYGVGYISLPTKEGKAYSEVIVSSLIKLPVDRAVTFVKDLVDMPTLGSFITETEDFTMDTFPEKYDGLMKRLSIYESSSDGDRGTYTVDVTYRYSSIPALAMWKLLNEEYDFKGLAGSDYVRFDYKPLPITKSIFDNNNVNWYPRTGHIVYEKAFTLKK